MNIRLATLQEQISIFSEPRLLDILPDKPRAYCLGDYLVSRGVEYYILTANYGKYRILFEYFPYKGSDKVLELHIACPTDSIRVSRLLSLLVVKYLFTEYPKLKGLITECPEGKIANLCRKLGGVKVGSRGDYVTMFATREQLGIK